MRIPKHKARSEQIVSSEVLCTHNIRALLQQFSHLWWTIFSWIICICFFLYFLHIHLKAIQLHSMQNSLFFCRFTGRFLCVFFLFYPLHVYMSVLCYCISVYRVVGQYQRNISSCLPLNWKWGYSVPHSIIFYRCAGRTSVTEISK